MKTFRFLDFKVYTDAKLFYKSIRNICTKVNDYSIKDQLHRASLSVILNIAEGSAKRSDKDFARFLEISIASINESVACLDVMKDVRMLNESEYKKLILEAGSIVKQLGGFIKKLYSKS